MYKKMRVLVIANNALSDNNSNGKVMKNYLNYFSDEELYSFFIDSSNSDGLNQDHYFCVDDESAFCSFVSLGFKKKNIPKNKDASNKNEASLKSKNALKYLLRYIVWNSDLWKTKEYKKWVDSIKPTHVCLMLGNNPYLYKLSRKIASKYKSKLIVFVGEDYPLKTYDYIAKTRKRGLFFRMFQSKIVHQCKHLFNSSDLVIFNSDYIKNDYIDKYVVKNSIVAYQPSSIKPFQVKKTNQKKILYAGNLGVGRFETILRFSEFLYEFDNDARLLIFSKLDQNEIDILTHKQNVIYRGFISNEALVQEIKSADIMIHIESNDKYNLFNLKNAFSTKIADMICSNRRIMLFAPSCLAETKYFLKNIPCNVATSVDELPQTLKYVFGSDYDFGNVQRLVPFHSIEKVSKNIRELFENMDLLHSDYTDSNKIKNEQNDC